MVNFKIYKKPELNRDKWFDALCLSMDITVADKKIPRYMVIYESGYDGGGIEFQTEDLQEAVKYCIKHEYGDYNSKNIENYYLYDCKTSTEVDYRIPLNIIRARYKSLQEKIAKKRWNNLSPEEQKKQTEYKEMWRKIFLNNKKSLKQEGVTSGMLDQIACMKTEINMNAQGE